MIVSSLLLVFLLSSLCGFSARRGTICLVRAVSEVVAGKPAKTLIFIVEAVTIALAVTIPVFLFFPDYVQLAASYRISPFLFFGALIYGVGVTINGGCAFGTLNHLMSGNINYSGTLLGMVMGFYLFQMTGAATVIDPVPQSSDAFQNTPFLILILFLSWIVIIIHGKKFLDSGIQRKLRQFINAPIARDFIAVSLLGISSGLLFLMFGHSWDYTHWIQMSAKILAGDEEGGGIYLSLSIATAGALLGIFVATLLSRSFRWFAIELKMFAIRVVAGLLMGIGASLIPGGNDTLIIYGLPGIAVYAPVAIFIIMVTIALILKLNSKNLFPLVWKEQ